MATKKKIKQRYEENADVRRWLNADQIDPTENVRLDSEDQRPDFNPSFLSEHHERDWLLSSLELFYQRHLIDDVVSVARSGKEATVYCCSAHPGSGYELLAAKTYRPRMFRSLKNDAVYRNNRATLDTRGRPITDKRTRKWIASGSERSRPLQVSAWIQHEYQTQRRLHEAGVTVPAPLSQAGNAILMEFIGDEGGPAPLLQKVRLEPEQAERLFKEIVADIERMLQEHVIHGDLSAYNILYWDDAAVIIDLAQAVDPRHSLDVFELLERDIDRVYRYFARYGVTADPAKLAADMWMRYLFG